MGHKQVFDTIVYRRYLPKIKAYKEKWNHQKQEIGFPLVTAYSLNEKNYILFSGAIENYTDNSRHMIYDIIICLLKEYGYKYRELPINGEKVKAYFVKPSSSPLWISETSEDAFMKCLIVDVQNTKILLSFRDFGIHNRITDIGLKRLNELFPYDDFFYVSFVFDKAYEEIIDHNDDESDVTRGTQCLSLKDFFLRFFDPSEYELLCEYLELYKKEVIEYMGVTVTRTLQPNAIPGFKSDIIRTITQKDYYAMLCNICPNHTPSRTLIEKLANQFLDESYYTALIGNNKFAISFLTAEWLYSSLFNIVTIDQTPIILGYFKAIEQILFDFVALQAAPAKANRLKTIKINSNSPPVILDEALLASRSRYMTLGTFTNFLAYTGNRDLIRSDLCSDPTLDAFGFISGFLRTLTDMRNEYLHRENIDNWQIVDKARDTAFALFFILLGGYFYEQHEKPAMGISNNDSSSPSISLCEYIHHKALDSHDFFEYPLFYINRNYKQPLWPDADCSISYDRYGNISYSGIYFHNIGRVDSTTHVELFYSLSELSELTIEEDVYVINKEDPFKSFIKGDRRIVYQSGVFTPRE